MNIPLTPLRCLRYAEQQFAHRTAVVCGNERFTYAEFAGRAARLGGALKKAGIKPGDRVAFLSMNCHRLLEAYYGVLEAGAVLLPLNVRLASHELAYILNDSGAKVLFLEKEFLNLVDSFRTELSSVESFSFSMLRPNPIGFLLITMKIFLLLLQLSGPTSWKLTRMPSPSSFTPAAPAPIPKASCSPTEMCICTPCMFA